MRIALATALALCLATPALANDNAALFLAEAAAAAQKEAGAGTSVEATAEAQAETQAETQAQAQAQAETQARTAEPAAVQSVATAQAFFLADVAAQDGAEPKSATAASADAAAATAAAPSGSGSVHALVTAAAMRHAIDPALAHAVATVESRYRCSAVGRAGELGVMQVKPATARSVGVTGNLRDCATGIEAGMRYLKEAIARHGDGCGGISAYNMGIHRKASFCNGYGRKVMAQMSRVRVASLD